MKALIFLQAHDGKIYYKCDSFWSKSNLIQDAKVYRDDSQTDIDSWNTSFKNNLITELRCLKPTYKEIGYTAFLVKLNNFINSYQNIKMGYRTIEDKYLKNPFVVNDTTRDSMLGELIYTHQICINIDIINIYRSATLDPHNLIEQDFSDDSITILDVRKTLMREQKINQILK